jgi:hypothetical protein
MGIKESGKDTCADHLVQKYNHIKKPFSDPLKRACQELFLFTDDQMYGSQEQKETPDPHWFGCTPRLALQYVGTDLLRNQLSKIMPELDTNIFTHHFKLWYDRERQQNPGLKVTIPDVRFANEVDLIHSLGGIVIKITRPNLMNSDQHLSEIELQTITSFDMEIYNDGTLMELYGKIDAIFLRDRINF